MKKLSTTILATIFLGLFLYYFIYPRISISLLELEQTRARQSEEQPVDGENAIKNIKFIRSEKGYHSAEITYLLAGKTPFAKMRAYAFNKSKSEIGDKRIQSVRVDRGEDTKTLRIGRDTSTFSALATRVIRVEMYIPENKKILAAKEIQYPIDWPARYEVAKQVADREKNIDALYREAESLIDQSSNQFLHMGRQKLEIILERDPEYVDAYPQLARFFIKTNWGPEGLRQAEQLLNTSLSIDPNHANALVLLGHVYFHQKRYKEAEDALSKASSIGTDNLWLWVNWARLNLKQGRFQDAINMFNKAIDGERPYNTYDRARTDAYSRLIDIYIVSKDFETANTLHLKRLSEYSFDACYSYDYAKFRQRNFEPTVDVLEYAKNALEFGCAHKNSIRKVIGTYYYQKWVNSENESEKSSYLAKARVNFTESADLIYWLSQSDQTAPIINSLVHEGISVDIKDNEGFTALAIALKNNEQDAMHRLIALGADPNQSIGDSRIPLLAFAIMNRNTVSVSYLLNNGAHVQSQVYEGVSLLELAENLGYSEIVELLKNSAGKKI